MCITVARRKGNLSLQFWFNHCAFSIDRDRYVEKEEDRRYTWLHSTFNVSLRMTSWKSLSQCQWHKKNVNKSKTIKTKRNFDWQHGQRSSSIGGANGSQSGTHTIQAHTVHPREEKPENFECGTSQFLNQTKPNNQHAYRFNMLTSVFFSIFFFRLVSFHFVWLLMLWIMY